MLLSLLLLALGQVSEGLSLQQPQPFKGRLDEPKARQADPARLSG